MKFVNNVVPLFKTKLEEGCRTSAPTIVHDLEEQNNGQLLLPFEAPVKLFMLSEREITSMDNFYHFLLGSSAIALFDMRPAPRLDFIASTRKKAFRVLEEVGINYMDMLGRTGYSPSDGRHAEYVELLKEIVLHGTKSCKLGETCVMVFDNDLFFQDCQNSLSHCFDIVNADSNLIAVVALQHAQLRM